MIRQGKILKQVQGPSRKFYHRQQKVGPWAKLPRAQVSRFTKNMRLLTEWATAQNTWPVSAGMRPFWAVRAFWCPQNPGSSTEQNEYGNKEGEGQGIKDCLGK